MQRKFFDNMREPLIEMIFHKPNPSHPNAMAWKLNSQFGAYKGHNAGAYIEDVHIYMLNSFPENYGIQYEYSSETYGPFLNTCAQYLFVCCVTRKGACQLPNK